MWEGESEWVPITEPFDDLPFALCLRKGKRVNLAYEALTAWRCFPACHTSPPILSPEGPQIDLAGEHTGIHYTILPTFLNVRTFFYK